LNIAFGAAATFFDEDKAWHTVSGGRVKIKRLQTQAGAAHRNATHNYISFREGDLHSLRGQEIREPRTCLAELFRSGRLPRPRLVAKRQTGRVRDRDVGNRPKPTGILGEMPELADQAPHIFLKKRIHSDRFSNLEDTHAAALELLRIGKSVDHLEGRTPLKEVITQP